MLKLIVFLIFYILWDLPKLYCFIYGQGGPGRFRDPSLKLYSGIVSPVGCVKVNTDGLSKGAIQGLLLVELFLGNYLGSFGLLLACFTTDGWIVTPYFLVYLWDFLSLLGRVTLLHNQHTHKHTPQKKKKKANVSSNIKTTNKLLISITLNIYCSLEEDEKDWGQSRRINWIDKPTKVIRF